MQQSSMVHGLPIQTSSSLAFLPSLGSSAIGDTFHISQVGSPYMPGIQQPHLAGLGGQLQQVQVLAPTLQTFTNGVVPSTQGAVYTTSAGAQFVQSGAMLQLPREQRTIFFAGCTPIVSSETIHALFSQFGTVEDINLFRPYSGSKTSKGCGLVVFTDRSAAASALNTLNGAFHWPGARGPMILEWLDPNKQHKKARAQPLSFRSFQHPHVTMAMQPGMPCMVPSHFTNQLYASPGQQLFC